MKKCKYLLLSLSLLVLACNGEKTADELFGIEIKNQDKSLKASETLKAKVVSKTDMTIDSVKYMLNGVSITSVTGTEITELELESKKLGSHSLVALVYSGGTEYEIISSFQVLSAFTPKLYTYNIIESYPHKIDAYTQGLEFHADTLYESTGQYRESTLRKTDYKTGDVLNEVKLADQYFAEGITILDDKIYQLTWREKTGFIYDLGTMKASGTFVYGDSPEGWGLCNDGSTIYKSDGTQKIWSLNKNNLAEQGFIEIYTDKAKIPKVNELEWVDGKIYANIYQRGAVAIVDPKTGAVEGVIDLNSLKDEVTQHDELDVLNGIAYKGEPNILYVTGKNWDKLFKIEIVEK